MAPKEKAYRNKFGKVKGEEDMANMSDSDAALTDSDSALTGSEDEDAN